MFLSNNNSIHASYEISNEAALLFYSNVQFTDINRFCHDNVFYYSSTLFYFLFYVQKYNIINIKAKDST